MIILGLIFCFLGSLLLVFAWGMPWWKRPHWCEEWSHIMISVGFIASTVGFILQIIGYCSR